MVRLQSSNDSIPGGRWLRNSPVLIFFDCALDDTTNSCNELGRLWEAVEVGKEKVGEMSAWTSVFGKERSISRVSSLEYVP